MGPLEKINLLPLMELSQGNADISVGLIDGPVVMDHPDLASENIREVSGRLGAACARTDSIACMHGTFVAGILSARRGSAAPAICPECSLLVRPIFPEKDLRNGSMPSATPEELAAAIRETVEAGARVINLSAALARASICGERDLQQALDFSLARNVIIVAAAGNQGMLGSSAITRHPWVIPVAGCDLQGRPTSESNLGSSIGKRGLSAPSENISSLGATGKTQTFGGTSAAAPFVTGTIALLWSEIPGASAMEVKVALTQTSGTRRNAIVPPVLNASAAYEALAAVHGR
jgi:subtilisin family serine protease